MHSHESLFTFLFLAPHSCDCEALENKYIKHSWKAHKTHTKINTMPLLHANLPSKKGQIVNSSRQVYKFLIIALWVILEFCERIFLLEKMFEGLNANRKTKFTVIRGKRLFHRERLKAFERRRKIYAAC